MTKMLHKDSGVEITGTASGQEIWQRGATGAELSRQDFEDFSIFPSSSLDVAIRVGGARKTPANRGFLDREAVIENAAR